MYVPGYDSLGDANGRGEQKQGIQEMSTAEAISCWKIYPTLVEVGLILISSMYTAVT